MRTLDDASPLNSEDIDVAARIGWIIRMARVATPHAGDTRLQAMAQRLGSSAAHLSRVETGQRRDSSLTYRYETALGMPEGALWSPIATLCRSFPRHSPRDSSPMPAGTDVRTFSELTALLLDEQSRPTGSEWLRWARSMGLEGNIGLPIDMFAQVTARLVNELGRSVSHAYPARYEALALMRCSPYGELVMEVARATFAAGDLHGRTVLARAVGESVTPDAVSWALDLLEHDATAFHGSLALETMGQVCAEGFWDELAKRLVALFDSSEPGTEAEAWVTHVIRLAPREVWRRAGITPVRALPAGPAIEDWSRSSENELWTWCTTQADQITGRLRLPSQPLLARLLFEIGFGPWETRALTSHLLLSAVPALSHDVAQRLATFVERHPESGSRDRVLRRLTELMHGTPVTGFDHWLRDEDPALRNAALAVAGSAGVAVPDDVLLPALTDPATSRCARYAAGMCTHPALDQLVECPRLSEETTAELRWWRDRGGRITL